MKRPRLARLAKMASATGSWGTRSPIRESAASE
jgi:hypothetical protein